MKAPKHHPTKQVAVNAANPRELVFVYNGAYKELVVIDKTLAL